MANENNNAAVFARIAELEAAAAELKALKAQTKNMARLKVSQKGAISVYGLQRMPVTLYAGQWERIIDMVEKGTLSDFIKANESALTRKTAKTAKSEAVKPASEPAAKSKRATRKGKQPARDIFA
tara:strand:- start:368 stop:742 length:375 start_codon:yes stop_codon:yes gene_type:complete